ncbi:MAG: hypothetical protein ACQEWW_13790 [Bacillota bacterium]
MNKTKTLLLAALSLTGLIVWFCQRGSGVIFKEQPVEIPEPESYSGEILWPQTDEEKKAAGEARGVAKSICSDRRRFLERSEGKPHMPSHVLDKKGYIL